MRKPTILACLVVGSAAAVLCAAGTATAAPAVTCGSSATPGLTYDHMRVVNGTCRQGRQMVVQFHKALAVPGCFRQRTLNDIHITCGRSKGMFIHVVSFTHPEWRLVFKDRTVFIDRQGGIR
ncbi:MAG: hypothetical protein ACOYL4_07890 [Miltoncostaeaceae bacterium]